MKGREAFALGDTMAEKLDVARDDLTALFGAAATLKDRFDILSDAQRWILIEIVYQRSAELKATFAQNLWPTP